MNGAAQTKVESYLEEEHTFNEYTEVKSQLVAQHLRSLQGPILSVCTPDLVRFFQLVEEFLALSREISSLPEEAHFTMIHLDCVDLKQGLAKKAKSFAEVIVARLVTDHREQNLK